MTHPNIPTYDDLDWAILWRNAREAKGWASKGPEDWDKKSASFASRNKRSPYIDAIISHLPLESCSSVLDIGSGPGTLALPLAQKGVSVTALDFSPGMLALLKSEAKRMKLEKITTIECAWEDDWEQKGVIPHDIAIASRSLGVEDLRNALHKLARYGSRYVFIADRISPTPFDPQLFKAIGRTFSSGPDYIYTLNMLYSMGIYPNVDIIELEKTLHFDNMDQAMESYTWMVKDITSQEKQLLQQYLIENALISDTGRVTLHRTPPPRWALIWWEPSRF